MVLEELIIAEYNQAKKSYPKLSPPEKKGGVWVITGSIDVIDEHGKNWGNYLVEIRFPEDYPNNPPDLIETGSKIIRHEDWHINKNGTCCLAPRARIFLKLNNKITLLGWLDKLAQPFLSNHAYLERAGEYAAGEFPHYYKGIIDSYREILGIDSEVEIIRRLMYVSGLKTMSRNDLCFCGSGKKYKRCYLKNIPDHAHAIPNHVLIQDLNDITIGLTKKRKGY